MKALLVVMGSVLGGCALRATSDVFCKSETCAHRLDAIGGTGGSTADGGGEQGGSGQGGGGGAGCVAVNDGNPCTADSCDSHTGESAHTLIDGCRACTSNLECDPNGGCSGARCGSDHICHPGTPRDIDDHDACTIDYCDPTGIHHTPMSADDGNPCTEDSCDPTTGELLHTPIDGCHN